MVWFASNFSKTSLKLIDTNLINVLRNFTERKYKKSPYYIFPIDRIESKIKFYSPQSNAIRLQNNSKIIWLVSKERYFAFSRKFFFNKFLHIAREAISHCSWSRKIMFLCTILANTVLWREKTSNTTVMMIRKWK